MKPSYQIIASISSDEGLMGFISDLSVVEVSADIGSEVTIWHFSQVRKGALIGDNSKIGMSVFIDQYVQVGMNCKIQNSAQIYGPAKIGNGVFIGPGVILTNDLYPRAVNIDLSIKSNTDWSSAGVNIADGASIGAGAICVAPVNIGAWSMIGAGAVVLENVPNHALIVGVPAKQIGWVSRSGRKLQQTSTDEFYCAWEKSVYCLVDGVLEENKHDSNS